ncbi:MAG: ABC transporter permease [Flavobacteriaceae bacterium CG_4_8_14_3_um_filter_34_10]|nr:FtsX-like permease family protein [Flavobacteriia bacterium]OIP50797.1 MAG: ABC transporter permease [Flavobacteriaceae bacterium CG2_30_34_30]PIQ17584.1 MAG: ABC transporter permease [Flavobacteriaceae bacterium CG18_big_fil_WC_8_21_14_2_50_34_36]PIV49080.1 MAG: ABC transporter permease [Flavobacteriaceae bacterium CG02_land_8_20_14_3_00_34_13]PIX10213.1 MAG: ABC transporter permease [Flavobacteriaceae bacterium CG_4_8_14_3_um_filter_34_10]PIZ08448.1 MAG: ABC transporter permease [Flavobac
MFSLLRENIRIALDSIRTQLLRTILTILIIAIGVFALVIILSAVKSLENTIAGDFSSMGANTFNIQRYDLLIQVGGNVERQKINPIISYNNIREFEVKYSHPLTQTSVSFTGTTGAEVKYDNKKTDPEVQVLGVNQNFLSNSGLELQEGRGFTIFDIENNNNVCILGADFMKGLFKDENPMDKTISIRGAKFKVIGVLEEKGSTFGNNQDLRVLVPIQIARGIFTEPNINYNISVKIDNTDLMDSAQEEAIITFRNIRGLSPLEENNFGIVRSDDLINRITSITGYLEAAAWIISIITIFGSSIALMNIMLVSVTERTREIGVRKSLGAKRNTIATQFLIETILIGQMGGVLGIILGLLGGFGFAAVVGFTFTVPWFAMLAATIISFVVAVIAGSYPAAKAARLDPIESLRYE